MKNHSFSIIVPCYNVEKYIDRIVESLLNQTFTHWEAIFINDGSTDKTLEKLSLLGEKDPRFKVINKKNEGVGLARNQGLKSAVNDFVIFIDPDDICEINMLQQVNHNLENDTDLLIFGYKEINEKEVVTREIIPKKRIDIKTNADFKDIFYELDQSNLTESPWNKVYKRNFLKENELLFPSQKKGQDYLFNLDIYKYVNKIIFLNIALYNYYIGRPESAQTLLSNDDYKYSMNILKKRIETYKHFELDSVKMFNEALISNAYYDSIKIFRYSQDVTDSFHFFLKTSNDREFNSSVKLINIFKQKRKNKIKLIFVKYPCLNYFYQKNIKKLR